MFAIDGVKLPSNADKRRSGTHAELRHEAKRMEKAVAKMVRAHRSRDEAKEDDADAEREAARLHRMQAEAKRIREFLATHEERGSDKGSARKSNVTDNDSAKMASSKGVLQGYTPVAAVDSKARTDQTLVTADAGYHSEENPRRLHDESIPALIADNLMRRRLVGVVGAVEFDQVLRASV